MIRTTIATAATAVLVPLTLTTLSAPAQASDQPAPRAAVKMAKERVTAKADLDVAIAREDKVKITGRVQPKSKAKGQKVILQQRVEGKDRWKRTGAAKVRKNGKFTVSDKPSTPGTRYYRVVKQAAKGKKPATSAEMKVIVYRWESLTDRTSGPSTNIERTTALIGTQSYADSLVTTTPADARIEYTLGGLCTSLTATYALTDGSASGAKGTAKLEADGATKVWEDLTVGAGKEHTSDVTGAFRVLFRFTASQTPDAQVTAANVKVLCTK